MHIVRTRSSKQMNVGEQQEGAGPDIGTQKVVEYVACVQTIDVVTE